MTTERIEKFRFLGSMLQWVSVAAPVAEMIVEHTHDNLEYGLIGFLAGSLIKQAASYLSLKSECSSLRSQLNAEHERISELGDLKSKYTSLESQLNYMKGRLPELERPEGQN